jgi:hypothetical protein
MRYSNNVLIKDVCGRIIAALNGRPAPRIRNDGLDDWEENMKEAHRFSEECGKRLGQAAYRHRRGKGFPALATGVSFGGGQRV